MKRRRLVTTSNYWRNLDDILDGRASVSESLLKSIEIIAKTLSTLRRVPDIGRPYRGTLEPLAKRIIERLGDGQIRESIAGELSVLYLSGAKQISVLAVRHQKQSSYSFN